MIPQDNVIVAAVVAEERVAPLRALLATMNFPGVPGVADPANALLPFGAFDTIHFARLIVLADNSLGDRAPYPQLPRTEPTYLCLMIDCDGDGTALLERMTRECPGLRRIFEFCTDFDANADLGRWLLAHRLQAAASYINWVGRGVVQVREEARLRELLREILPHLALSEPQLQLSELRSAAREKALLTPIPPTPLDWRMRNLVDLLVPIIVGALALILFPFVTVPLLVVVLILGAIELRRGELTDPIVVDGYDAAWVTKLRLGEDHDVTNQYTAMGSIKPGWFRLNLARLTFYAINWFARHVFTQGGLARIGTIHFAHWVFLDSNRRMFFCSYYDGAHEAYMDDFINKVGFGLNLSFSGAIAYPLTDWLLAKGAGREQDFKRFQRHHQIPTDVWYKAYPGLTARDLARNSRIRNGFEKATMSDDEIRRWLAEI
jgi:hypothetical protein